MADVQQSRSKQPDQLPPILCIISDDTGYRGVLRTSRVAGLQTMLMSTRAPSHNQEIYLNWDWVELGLY